MSRLATRLSAPLLLVCVSCVTAGCGSAGSGEEPGATGSDLSLSANAHPAYSFFVSKGLTPAQAAGIVGNLEQESGVSPTIAQYGGGPGRGIAQWSTGGRWDTDHDDNVAWYAQQQGQSEYSLTLQLSFIWYELQTFSSYGLSPLRASTTVSSATIAFQNDFEGCGTCAQSTRIAYAQAVLSAYGSSGNGGSSGSSSGGSSGGSSSGSGGGGSSSGGSGGSGSSSGGCGTVPAGSIARSTTIANAEQWVSAQLQYCQSANGQPDADTSCSSVCNRTSNAAWDPYRSDCSGLVSWAWGLPAPGLVTDEFAPFSTAQSTTIDCTALQPGDAANRNSVGHIVLFKQWVTPGSEAVFIEEPGCSAAEPYAHEFTSAVTCSGSDIDITYEGATFTAIRYVNIVDDPSCGGGGSSSGSSSGGSSSGSGSGSSSGGVPAGDCVLAGQAYVTNTCTETLQCDNGSWVTRTSDPSSCDTGVEPSGGCLTDSGSIVPQNTCTTTLQCDNGVWVDRTSDPAACL